VLEHPFQFFWEITIFLTLLFRLVDGEFKIIGSSGVIEFNWFIDYSACFLMMGFFRKNGNKMQKEVKKYFCSF
jgi:hypothetical protein